MNRLSKRMPRLMAAVMALAACVILSGPSMEAFASKGDLVSIDVGEERINAPMEIILGKAEIVTLEGAVSDVMVADPSIVDVQAVQSHSLYVVGLNIGDTNVIILDAEGNILKRIDIHVSYDLQAIRSLVARLFPEEEVKIDSIHGQLLLTGTTTTPEAASKIANLVSHYVGELIGEDWDTLDQWVVNLMDVRGEQQVMLQVKIIEATRNVLRELGLQTNFNDPNELSTTTLFGGVPGTSQFNGNGLLSSPAEAAFATGAGLALSQDPVGSARAILDSGIHGIGSVGLFLDALEEEGMVNILAEPNLTAVSGEQAGFLAGGEFPVPVGRDQVGNLVIEFREFGVSLNFRPMVMSDKRISLQMNTEVSSLDFDNAITLADVQVPGLDVRRAETTVEIPSGGSLMIAGLLQSEAVKGMAGLPGIRKTPVIGDLVSSESFKREETELVVIVTSYTVEPYADKAKAEEVPKESENPLSKAFAKNIRRAFGLKDNEIFIANTPFGYLLD